MVVLEWTNEDCPYVRKHYTGPMQALQQEATAGRRGLADDHLLSAGHARAMSRARQARSWRAEYNASFTHLLADPTGETGRAYGAVTTPDMRVIDEEGRVIFTGGIDDRPSADVATPGGRDQLCARGAGRPCRRGRPVATPFAQPYGCSIKYADELEEGSAAA